MPGSIQRVNNDRPATSRILSSRRLGPRPGELPLQNGRGGVSEEFELRLVPDYICPPSVVFVDGRPALWLPGEGKASNLLCLNASVVTRSPGDEIDSGSDWTLGPCAKEKCRACRKGKCDVRRSHPSSGRALRFSFGGEPRERLMMFENRRAEAIFNIIELLLGGNFAPAPDKQLNRICQEGRLDLVTHWTCFIFLFFFGEEGEGGGGVGSCKKNNYERKKKNYKKKKKKKKQKKKDMPRSKGKQK